MPLIGQLAEAVAVLDHPAIDSLKVSSGWLDVLAVDDARSRLDTRDESSS